jgi:hypothetical protein
MPTAAAPARAPSAFARYSMAVLGDWIEYYVDAEMARRLFEGRL